MTLPKFLAKALFSTAWLWMVGRAPAVSREPNRRYEIYSDVRDAQGDLEGTELDLFLWEDNTAEATLTVYRRFVQTHPVRLRGLLREEEVSISVSRGEETLEIRGRRFEDRFAGQMIYRNRGEIVRSAPLNLPRKKLKG